MRRGHDANVYEAAQTLLTRVTKWSWLKARAVDVAKRRGQQKAIVAPARRLAVFMHRIWSDGRSTLTATTPIGESSKLGDSNRSIQSRTAGKNVPEGRIGGISPPDDGHMKIEFVSCYQITHSQMVAGTQK
ncbi:hypothetical protein MesoLj131c_68100 (plasmid) [Mesorhizobium sp. 131-3-5]|nr:hypothetical protein MesoLj131c_68100 [Mesorhizobium sp. 131-3-5]